MKKSQNRHDPNDMAFYMFMFKIEGHETWRCVLGKHVDKLKKEVKSTHNFPKITALNVLRVDRVTGDIAPFAMEVKDVQP